MNRGRRAAVPAVAVAAAVSLAGFLYAFGYRGEYHALLQAWGAAPFRFPFLDMHGVDAAIECHRLGFDVFVENPCDVLRRVHPYSPLWLWLSVLPITTGWDNALGLASVLLFLVALAFLPSGRGGWQIGVITLGAVSSVVMFALERANVDVIMFVLATLAARLTLGRTPSRTLGYGLALLSGMLKFYPIVLLVLAVRERLGRFILIGLIAVSTIVLWFVLDSHEIMQAMANIPTTLYFDEFTFGARDLPFGLAQTLGWSRPAAFCLMIVLLAGTTGVAAGLAKRDDTAARLRHLTEAEATFLLMGSVLTIGCFVVAQNVLYRSIYFLFVLPGLTALARVDGRRRLDGVYFVAIGAIIVLMWNDTVRTLINGALGWFNVSARPGDVAHFYIWLVREAMWWGVVLVLAALMLRLVLDAQTTRDAARLLSAKSA
jgi:hypothetical protein